MKDAHNQNIVYLSNLLNSKKIDGIVLGRSFKIDYFSSGGGTHLYLIQGLRRKYLARINFYDLKNGWGVKTQEFKVLKKIEGLKIAPRVYYLNTKNQLHQDFTIVDFLPGEVLTKINDKQIIDLAKTLRKLHSSIVFKKAGDTIPPTDNLPYSCDVFNEFANGEDKQIEKYKNLEGISKVIKPYNEIRNELGKYFNALTCFDGINKFCLVHADLKKENILTHNDKITLIDWECAGSDIPESDIGRLFAGCRFNKRQEELFLKNYFPTKPNEIVLKRIASIKMVIEFFNIIDDYILHNRKKWNAEAMFGDLLRYEKRHSFLK